MACPTFRSVVGLSDDEVILIMNGRMRSVLLDIVNTHADKVESLSAGSRTTRRQATLLRALAHNLRAPQTPAPVMAG